MAIKYRNDPHLEFLQALKNNELEVLVDILIRDPKDKKLRLTEELTSEERYEKYSPNHKKYWDLIAGEYQLFGGNTFMNIFRGGEGVLYEEILKDVAKKLKVKIDLSKASVGNIEQELLLKVIENILNQMSEEEKENFVKELNSQGLNLNTNDLSSEIIIKYIRSSLKLFSGIFAYIISNMIITIIIQWIGKEYLIGVIAKTIAKRIFLGPIGWAFSGLLAISDISGEAYRVTIPATIYIAALRQSELKQNLFKKFIRKIF